jgi:exosortase A-associated hydrolase 1
MGDSEGKFAGFEYVADDIRSAVDLMYSMYRPRQGVVLLGLCDGASAALLYCMADERVGGLILINPWVRSEYSQAAAIVRTYYGSRVLQRDFWRKLLRGELRLTPSLLSFFRNFVDAARASSAASSQGFIARMLAGLSSFQRPVLIAQSGRDLTADEFRSLCRENDHWRAAASRTNVEIADLIGADHTFSGPGQLADFEKLCLAWLERNFSSPKCR